MLLGRKITVLGAGVGGLAVARALALRGAQVTVLEQSEAIREVGAGLQVSPNGARVLRALGLGEALDSAGPQGRAVELWDGPGEQRLLRMNLPERHAGQSDVHYMHRARLISLLAQGARDAGVSIRLLHRVEQVTLGAHPPRLTTAQGVEMEADLLIGADGLHSKLRTAINGTAAPFFTHQTAWRALLPVEPDAEPVAQVFMGPGRHLVTYPLGGGLRNIVAVQERQKWIEESWSLTDDSIALRTAFSDFGPKVRGWLDQVEAPGLWGLFRHPVAARWHAPGAVLLGDAVHPTLPFFAQGACLALEDAWVLAEALAGHDSDAAAFAAYQQTRAARVAKVVGLANGNARNYHLSGLPRAVAHMGLRTINALAPGRMLKRFDWVYDHDVTAGA